MRPETFEGNTLGVWKNAPLIVGWRSARYVTSVNVKSFAGSLVT